MKKIAIMTAGGDCAGLNSAIKSIVMTANTQGIEVLGVMDGYIGFVEGRYTELNEEIVRSIETKGGTMLGSSNKECPFHYYNKKTGEFDDRVDEGIEKLREQGVEGMVIIGGDGTLDSARVIYEHGMPTVGIPKTIDNDMSASEPTIGFQTAIDAAVDAIRKLITTAYSHRRVMVVELMGRTSGYLTLHAGFASGADIILLPEQDYSLKVVCDKVDEIMKSGKRYVIIAVSEAAKEKGGEETIAKLVKDSFEQKRYGGVSQKLAAQIEQLTGYETRATILGHIQRGGEPTTSDIILGARLGNAACKLLINGEPGYIVGIKGGTVVKMAFPKDRVPRLLNMESDDLCRTARDMGVCFGQGVNMSNLFIEYPKCSTCKKAKKYLEDNKVEFIDRNIVEETPTIDELKSWINLSKKPINKFFNTSGILYRQMELSKKLPDMSDDEKIKLLSSNGMLIKRPLLVLNNNVLIGFKEKEWEEEI